MPFILGASALVIASAASFHAKYADVLAEDGTPFPQMEKAYYKVLDGSLATHDAAFITLDDTAKSATRAAAPLAEKQLAAMLSNRDSVNLAQSLEPSSPFSANMHRRFSVSVCWPWPSPRCSCT